MHYKEVKLENVWRTCNKIRATIFRNGLNLWSYFLPLDPQRNCLISESKFISVFDGQLKKLIGLSEQEILELCNYFRVSDGRIFYKQLCEVVCENVPDFTENRQLVTGLEWEDPLHVNRLSTSEHRRLKLLITKIASLVNMRKLILRPYFQDYELLSKNNGTVTIAHFARILHYLGILVSSNDFNILVKRYLKDSYTLNYVAFITEIDEIVNYMDQKGILSLGGNILSVFPGKMITADLPKLPRPEIGKVLAHQIFGDQTIFHPALEDTNSPTRALVEVLHRIQHYVSENRVRINEFFRDYDMSKCGRITVSQFCRALDNIGISGIHRLYLSLPEIEAITMQYRDPCDPSRVCWKTFEDDIDHIFTTKELEKCPCLEVETPTSEFFRQSDSSSNDSACYEQAIGKIKRKLISRRILLRNIFSDHDKLNKGYVSRSQMRQCVLSLSIPLSHGELCALEERFNSPAGFNYYSFLKEAESDESSDDISAPEMHRVKPPKVTPQEKDIILILAKIKGKVVRERIRVMEFMRDFDKHNELVISRDEFARGLSTASFVLTDAEVETLMDVFGSPLRKHCVDYRRFSEVVEEAFTQSCLERAPLVIPVQHIPTRDSEKNFLNFNERIMLSKALKKLSTMPELKTNLMSLFKDYDKYNCGTVSIEYFTKALTIRKMYSVVTNPEFDVVCKCYGLERGCRNEIDYRAFVKSLEILHEAEKYKAF